MNKEKIHGDNRPLTLAEKWDADIESYKKLGGMPMIDLQCKKCKNWIKTEAWHCLHFHKTKKPKYIFNAQIECPGYKSADKIEINISNDFESKVTGGLLGAIVGDALGVPVEFSERISRRKDPVQEMRAYGTYQQPFGTWSDDSSMMLCLIEAIIEDFSLSNLANKFVAFADNAYLTPYDRVFDIGNAVSKAINKIKSGISPVECGGTSEYDNGNGSLMRILPLAFLLRDEEPNAMIQCVEDVSSITHKHCISRFACIFYIQMAIELLKDTDKKTAYVSAIDFVKQNLSDEYEPAFSAFERLMSGRINCVRIDNISSSGYVVDTLEAAVWSFLNTKTYSDCVFQAINLGGDTDTTACVAGGLAGIHYGFCSVPDRWIQMLAKKQMLAEMLTKYIKKIE